MADRPPRGDTVIRATSIGPFVAAAILISSCARDTTPPAPDYVARRLGSREKVSLSSLRGRVVLLNAWATWCVPCREEMPAFERLHARYRDRGLRIVGVNVDEGQEDGAVEAQVRSLGLTFDIWRDPESRLQKRFRTLGVPETVLLDRSGAVVRHWRGAIDPGAPENVVSIDGALGLPSEGAQRVVSPAASDPLRTGRRLADQRGCLTCHSLDGTPQQGPSFRGAAGTMVRLADGRTVVRDRAYLVRSIVDPDVEIVATYPERLMAGAMPGRPLTPAEVDALVAFISSQSVGP